MNIKIDLHTHSTGSPDGGLRIRDYQAALDSGRLDYCAVTDHNTIDQAIQLQRRLGERIIVGEEVMANEGEIIGLYLHQLIPGGLSAKDTVDAIKQQGGLVYVPHPFETVRKGLSTDVLASIADSVDIIETHNGRAVFQNKGHQALFFARDSGLVGASSSDAHGKIGWGKAYTIIDAEPRPETLVGLLRRGQAITGQVGAGVMYPKYHRFRRRIDKMRRAINA